MRKKSKLRNTTKKVKSVRVTADDAVKHSTGIMAEREDPIRERLMKVAGLLRPILSAEDRETLDRCLALYDRNEFVIMVAGEISVGKSSFLNALIGQSILLTDATETTAAITYLRSAEGVPDVKPDHVKITYKDGRVEWIDMHDHKRMLAATTSLDGNKKAISRVKMAEVFLSRKTLDIPRGITIIDTPGLNGSDSHSDLTHREMGLCHVALYLLDATKFGTSSNEREFAKLYRYAPEVLFVVNKWDLVRATGCDLRKMKSETYFPKLGNWAKDGEVSDANIFVVSGSEALTAREQYFERRKKEDRLHPNQRTKFTDRDCLPSPDNEYFDLEGRLQEIMRDSEMSKLIRRRPIQTLSELVRQQLERIEQREKQLMAEDEDLKRKLDLEKMRVRQGKDAAEKAFNEVRDFAARLWEIEDRAYRETLADGIKKLQEVVGAEIDELAPSVLQSEVGQKKLASFVRKKVRLRA